MSLITRTVQSNLTLQQAEARVREARAQRRIAAADLWPQADAAAAYTRGRTSSNGLSTGRAGQAFNLFQAGFDANWELDVFGGNRRAVEAANASVEAAEDERNAVVVSLMAEVGLDYVTYRSLQQRVALANQNVKAQQDTLDLTRRLFNAGLAPEIDVQRAAAQVATTASTIPLFEQQAAQAMHALGVLIGEPPMTLQEELAAVRPIPQPPPAGRRRPAVRALAAPARRGAVGTAACGADGGDRRRHPRPLSALLHLGGGQPAERPQRGFLRLAEPAPLCRPERLLADLPGWSD